MNGDYLFDTNAVVYYLQGRTPWVDFIDNTSMVMRSVSVITRMELLSYPGLEEGEEEGIRRFFSDIVVMPLNDVIENEAVAIRKTARLKLPDAVIVATAVVADAMLITGDQRIARLTWHGLRTINPSDL